MFTAEGIPESIVQRIRSFIDVGKLQADDVDSRVCEQLRSCPDDVDALFDEFDRSDLTGVVNRGAFLCNLIKQWTVRHPSTQGAADLVTGTFGSLKPGPNEARLKVTRYLGYFPSMPRLSLVRSKSSNEQAIRSKSLPANGSMEDRHPMGPTNPRLTAKYALHCSTVQRHCARVSPRFSSANFRVTCSRMSSFHCANRRVKSGTFD